MSDVIIYEIIVIFELDLLIRPKQNIYMELTRIAMM